MKKLLALLGIIIFLAVATPAFAATGIFPTGGGTKTVGSTFTISLTASGANFDALQGVISVSGPVSIVSFTPGPATWLPGKTPANGSQFVGMTSTTNSLTVATIILKANSIGSGSVSVSAVRLALAGNEVGTSGGSAGFTIIQSTAKTSSSAPATTATSTTTITTTPAIDTTLAKPSNISISKADNFSADQSAGTVSGLVISGLTIPTYIANLIFDPELTLPADKTLTVVAGADGKFSYNIDYPIKSGFYKLTIQGKKDLALTPKSDEVTFEVSVANGGALTIFNQSTTAKKSSTPIIYFYIAAGALVLIIILLTTTIIRRQKKSMPVAKILPEMSSEPMSTNENSSASS